MRARGAKVRTNTVVTRTNLADLADTCRLACELDVNHINISNLHPVGSALNIRHRVMPSFSEMQPHIRAAVDCVRANRRKITLEGFPYCMVRDRAADHLNNSPRGIRMLIHGQVIDDYDAFMSRTMRVLGEECGHCAMSPLCGGAYPQYVELYGWSEFHAIGHPHELETAAMAQRSGGKVES
jgi:MoaA/NifB/PqqE/SkfB family radical SAM enzyme